jgi:hypothetical protein
MKQSGRSTAGAETSDRVTNQPRGRRRRHALTQERCATQIPRRMQINEDRLPSGGASKRRPIKGRVNTPWICYMG